MLSWHGQERYSRKTEAADLRRAFTILDANNDDRVDAEELAQLFRKLGHKEKKVHDISTSCSNVELTPP
jgi:Ca2+-binding EF-hand superfamily protein